MRKLLVTCLASQFLFIALAHASQPTPQMQTILDELEFLGGKPMERLTAVEGRRQPTVANAMYALLAHQGRKPETGNLARVEDTQLGETGLLARVYTPSLAPHLPLVVYFHGGGWAIGSLDSYDASARAIASKSQAIVVSVAYRLAPESRFPSAHDDAYEAYKWVVQNAPRLGADGKRVAVAGEDAGGNLAINVSIRARDEGFRIPVTQIAIYPIAGVDENLPSYVGNQTARPLNRRMMRWFFEHYFRTLEDARDPRIDLLAADLRGLPPTLIVAAAIDPLSSEDALLAIRLRAQEVKTSFVYFAGVTHEFYGMSPLLDEASRAQDAVAESLREGFLPGHGSQNGELTSPDCAY